MREAFSCISLDKADIAQLIAEAISLGVETSVGVEFDGGDMAYTGGKGHANGADAAVEIENAHLR